jgi:hypothetical protein
MPQVRSVSLSVSVVDRGRYRAVVDLAVITYPFGSVPVDVVLLVDGRAVASKTVVVPACGRPPDQPCPGRCEFELSLPEGMHVFEARARDHGDDKMYPDDFIRSLRPVEKWIYIFYPVVYVRALGSTASPRVITSPEAFANSVKSDFWYYKWQGVRVVKWEDVPCQQTPWGVLRCLKSVEWEGTFIYQINADETTEGVASRIANWMIGRWDLESSSADACVHSVYAEQYLGVR